MKEKYSTACDESRPYGVIILKNDGSFSPDLWFESSKDRAEWMSQNKDIYQKNGDCFAPVMAGICY